MNNYLRYNPIAKRIFEEEASRISDSNLSIENLIKSVCNNSFDIFKIVCFDLGSSVERNPDNLREKLKDIADSKSVREVTSKLKDYCSESEISSRLLSDTKNI